ncbi:hypothetical protein [Paraglaciecola sp.]|uniref:fibronectin type III domain-containing protein n=1 Tax=Paraglaciecola sp. TaxID=1920173 RepID=UPI003EF2FB61
MNVKYRLLLILFYLVTFQVKASLPTPGKVENLQAIKNNGSSVWQGSDMTFKWNKPSGFTGPLTYTIELKEPNKNKWTWKSGWSSTSKVRSNMNTTGTYNFWVRACNQYGSCGSATNLNVSVVPLAITGLTAIKNNGSSVWQGSDMTFKWSKPSGYTKSLTYTIELQEPNKNKWIWKSGWSSTSKVRSNMNTTGTYNFWVRACNQYGSCGSATNLNVSVVPLAITGLTAIKNNGSSVWQGSDMTFKWSKPSGYTKSLTYTIELQEPNKNKWIWKSGWSSTSKVRSNMNTTGTYNFWVRACNQYDSCGSASNLSVSVVPWNNQYPTVVNFAWSEALTKVGQAVSFSWDISEIESCTGSLGGATEAATHASSGTTSDIRFYTTGEHITQWYCTDLTGNRFPVDANTYLESSIEVKHLSAPQNLKEQPSE